MSEAIAVAAIAASAPTLAVVAAAWTTRRQLRRVEDRTTEELHELLEHVTIVEAALRAARTGSVPPGRQVP